MLPFNRLVTMNYMFYLHDHPVLFTTCFGGQGQAQDQTNAQNHKP